MYRCIIRIRRIAKSSVSSGQTVPKRLGRIVCFLIEPQTLMHEASLRMDLHLPCLSLASCYDIEM